MSQVQKDDRLMLPKMPRYKVKVNSNLGLELVTRTDEDREKVMNNVRQEVMKL